MAEPERKLLVTVFAGGRSLELTHDVYINGVDLSKSREPNTASIVVHNLGASNRGALSADHQAIEIVGGYGEGSNIFSGQTFSVSHKPTNPGWETTIEAGDGVKPFVSSWTSNSWGEGTPVSQVLGSMASDMGAPLDARVSGTLNATWAYNGRTSEGLSEFCQGLGAQWSIYQGVLEVLTLDEAIDRSLSLAVDVSKLTGMIGSPEVVERKKGKFGVGCKTLMNPAIRPNGLVKVTSGATGGTARNKKGAQYEVPGANGVYRVKRVNHYGSLFTPDFYTEFETESFSAR